MLTAKVDIDGCNVTGINFIAGFRNLLYDYLLILQNRHPFEKAVKIHV